MLYLKLKILESKIVSTSHFPVFVMVWAGFTSTGKTPFVFVEKEVKINADFYQKVF